jgi:hypothetical protein
MVATVAHRSQWVLDCSESPATECTETQLTNIPPAIALTIFTDTPNRINETAPKFLSVKEALHSRGNP